MQIEIEYRVWDKFNGQYWYSENYKSLSKFFEAMEHLIEGGNELIFERPTGLKDKNGVKIFEWDICKVLYTDWPSKLDSDPRTIKEYMNDIAKTCIVYYDFNGFYFTQSLQNPYSQDMDVSPHGFIEIIGNIHQNPELLQ